MKISTAFPSNYLKASDLNGQNVTVIMSRVAMEQIGKDREERPVIYFRNHEKGMVLNKTNTKKISEIFGDETDEWSGGEIILYPAMVEFQGDTVEALRVRHAPKRTTQKQEWPATGTMEGASMGTVHRSSGPTPGSQTPEKKAVFDDYIGTMDTMPDKGIVPSSLLPEAEIAAKGGIVAFREWRDGLLAEDYETLKPDMGRLTAIAKQITQDGKGEPRPQQLSEAALKVMKK
jgi:hypothetical protein